MDARDGLIHRVHRSGKSYLTNELYQPKPRWVIRIPIPTAIEMDGNVSYSEQCGWGDVSGKVTFDARIICECMTKEMVIEAIECQLPDMKVDTKLQKFALIKQWLHHGGDPHTWEPLQIRYRAFCERLRDIW